MNITTFPPSRGHAYLFCIRWRESSMNLFHAIAAGSGLFGHLSWMRMWVCGVAWREPGGDEWSAAKGGNGMGGRRTKFKIETSTSHSPFHSFCPLSPRPLPFSALLLLVFAFLFLVGPQSPGLTGVGSHHRSCILPQKVLVRAILTRFIGATA